jgi:hypothetical protein
LLGSAPFSGSVDYTDGYVLQLRDSISFFKRNHLIKTGVEIRQQRPYMHNAITGDTYGRFEFTGAFSGYDYADMLLGLPFRTNLDQVRFQSLFQSLGGGRLRSRRLEG